MKNEYSTIAKTDSPEQTKELAAKLASCLKPNDTVLLTGDLGAGKTQFVQGVAAALGAHDAVISPTFNIVISYLSGKIPLHHFDLYRLDSTSQLEDIGLREYLESDGVCFVEWAEKFPEAFEDCLSIRIGKTSEDGREITACAAGERSRELLQDWRKACTSNFEEPDRLGVESVPAQASAVTAGNKPSVNDESMKRVQSGDARYVLAFDTANEVVAIGVGALDAASKSVELVATREIQAHRASNTTLVPAVDELLGGLGISRHQLACICVGRGPGSFTGVRIAMATAKGISQALGVGLVGVSTLDAIAWNAQSKGIRGDLLVVADAMRKEVYPVRYALFDDGARRQSADRVVKAEAFAGELGGGEELAAECASGCALDLLITGDGLVKYHDLFEPYGRVLDEGLWNVTGAGLLMTLQALWQAGEIDPFDNARHNPAFALPVYTRLSDAEENERIKLAKTDEKNLTTGVQDVAPDGGKGRVTMHSEAVLRAMPDDEGVAYCPMAASHVNAVAQIEPTCFTADVWNERMVADELGQRDRTWWVALVDGEVVGYAGGMIVDGDMQVLKVAVDREHRRQGIASELISRIADDARNLGATTCSLEVRVSNEPAQACYEALGLKRVGVRPGYYPDREDAVIMNGPLPCSTRDVAGMELQHIDVGGSVDEAVENAHPLILAIESSCDETAAAIVDGAGNLLSDVVASQIDFHARFGGVVPEIASRKHIEAICGVCDEALETAEPQGVAWNELDAIAVTYAPGLLGALVVGVAYAKGAAWALDVPFIGVNHLEGHLYANKIGDKDFEPPAVVSLVSGGNTLLVHMRDWGEYETLGSTIDDAVGEAFDKVSKALGLGYPGGPVISKYAAQGNPAAIEFPRAMLHSHDFRFSLSGLKTAVVNYINKERSAGRELNIPDIAASFQQAVVDVQVAKAKTALEQTGARTFCLGGGVAANPVLRKAYESLCERMGVKLVMPPLHSCGDNAGMIALVALDRFKQQKFFDLSADALAHANLDEPY